MMKSQQWLQEEGTKSDATPSRRNSLVCIMEGREREAVKLRLEQQQKTQEELRQSRPSYSRTSSSRKPSHSSADIHEVQPLAHPSVDTTETPSKLDTMLTEQQLHKKQQHELGRRCRKLKRLQQDNQVALEQAQAELVASVGVGAGDVQATAQTEWTTLLGIQASLATAVDSCERAMTSPAEGSPAASVQAAKKHSGTARLNQSLLERLRRQEQKLGRELAEVLAARSSRGAAGLVPSQPQLQARTTHNTLVQSQPHSQAHPHGASSQSLQEERRRHKKSGGRSTRERRDLTALLREKEQQLRTRPAAHPHPLDAFTSIETTASPLHHPQHQHQLQLHQSQVDLRHPGPPPQPPPCPAQLLSAPLAREMRELVICAQLEDDQDRDMHHSQGRAVGGLDQGSWSTSISRNKKVSFTLFLHLLWKATKTYSLQLTGQARPAAEARADRSELEPEELGAGRAALFGWRLLGLLVGDVEEPQSEAPPH